MIYQCGQRSMNGKNKVRYCTLPTLDNSYGCVHGILIVVKLVLS